ncbi:MAG: DUF5606 family protein [Chitinophagaceae bacterium]
MKYKEIVSVSGLGGLFQLISSKSDGAIVKSLEDLNTRFISSRVHQFTPLETIEIFTSGENVKLSAILQVMGEKEKEFPLVDAKADTQVVREYFRSIFPSLDEERVYVSDLKKMIRWFTILKKNDLLPTLETKEPEPIFSPVAEEISEIQKNPAPKVKKAKKGKTPV